MAVSRTTCCALAFSFVLATFAVTATAQDDSDPGDVAEARRLFEEGEQLYVGRSFARAEAAFRRAWELMEGHPRRALLLVNIGRSIEEQRGREEEALATYQRMLDATGDADDSTVREGRELAQERIAELRARLEARAGTEAEDSEPQPQGEGPGSSISPIGPVVLGVGGATIIAGVILGAFSLGQAGAFRDECEDLTMCPSALRPQYDEMRTFSAVADGLYVAGALTAALGLVLMLTLSEDAAQETSVSTACGPDGCSVVVRGTL